MVKPKDFVDEIKKQGIDSVIEVPCSIFKDLIAYIIDTKELELINPVNEAVVMANAAGKYLATGKLPLILMQNSGLNNTLNALTSLNIQYKIPALYIISWRGEPGKADAEEHNFMGPNLEKILETYKIPFKILGENYSSDIKWAVSNAMQSHIPTALIMKKGFIEKYLPQNQKKDKFGLDRWQAIESIVDNTENTVYVSTNGFPSRVLFNILKSRNKEDGRAFYMVGSMGHALGIGESLAKEIPKAKVIVIDGDGSAVMHLGSMAAIAEEKPDNLVHIILDNKVYGSTGGQPTLSKSIDFMKIAQGFGYHSYEADTKEKIANCIGKALKNGPAMIHIEINSLEKPENEMERVNYSCEEIKQRFENHIKKFK
jgi:phosphonopyruvate decarboxylase